MTELTGDPGKAIRRRVLPTLIQMGTRIVPSDRRWHPALAKDYIRDHGGKDRWVTIDDLARTFFGSSNKTTRIAVRRRMAKVWLLCLGEKLLLVFDFKDRKIAKVKLYDPRSTEERTYVRARIAQMEQYRQLKAEQCQRAISLADCLELATDGR